MAICSQHHKELDKNGEGKCSVPMWINGCPAGFCDEPAYGFPIPYETMRSWDGQDIRLDGGYTGYVPYLACPAHGGPKKQNFIILWIEGFAATGQSGVAQCLGTYPGTLHDAIKAWVAKDLIREESMNWDRMTFWGCRFFDNELDARKSFG